MRRFASVSISASSSALNRSLIANQKKEGSESKLVPTDGETSQAISLSYDEDTMAMNLSGVSSETPVYGVMSVAGRLRDMEDAITVRTDLCRPEINLSRPVHFFGVYDGHGGPHVIISLFPLPFVGEETWKDKTTLTVVIKIFFFLKDLL